MSENVLTPAQIEESRAMFRKGCRLGVEREDALCDAALRAGELEAALRELVLIADAKKRLARMGLGPWNQDDAFYSEYNRLSKIIAGHAAAIDEARRLLERTPT